ncbi:MAG: MotA/TolQ/ExbB proton channel family protein, partial [Rubrivivax sp.]|nr:MotA/TolQ/ExbB proton channel family protein [Rubrivivax sp.]
MSLLRRMAVLAGIALVAALPATGHAQAASEPAAGASAAAAPAPAPAPAPAAAAAPAVTEEAVDNPYGLKALWTQGDFVARGTLIIMIIMSMGSWYVIFTKL